MAYTSTELEKIEAHCKRFSPSACPICESTDWKTIPYPGAIVAQQEKSVNIYKALQVVQLVCENCGYVIQFDASKIDVEQ